MPPRRLSRPLRPQSNLLAHAGFLLTRTLPEMITAAAFTQSVGNVPEQDDLERVNCDAAGTPGHYACGWCLECDKPRFVCGHILVHRNSFAENINHDR